jgi:hypothetical protein
MIQICQHLPTCLRFHAHRQPARFAMLAAGVLIQSAVELEPPGRHALLTVQTGEGEHSVALVLSAPEGI